MDALTTRPTRGNITTEQRDIDSYLLQYLASLADSVFLGVCRAGWTRSNTHAPFIWSGSKGGEGGGGWGRGEVRAHPASNKEENEREGGWGGELGGGGGGRC